MLPLQELSIHQDKLLFHPNNYRFQDLPDFVWADENRFHEESVQRRAFERLKADESLSPLKLSILKNSYLPVEKIVVQPYSHMNERYLVVEGNRRLAAIRWIISDHEAGVATVSSVLESIATVPALVIIEEKDGDAQVFLSSLLGIRHVSGIKQWGGYQRAKLVVEMRDSYALSASEVAERLGMQTQEVNRRYRAFKALQQMQQDEDFGPFAKPNLYPLFHEAISQPLVRDWLKWNEEEVRFANEEDLRIYYSLLSPLSSEEVDGAAFQESKITTYHQVRNLKDILPKPEAKRLLLDQNASFLDALAAARQADVSHEWASSVNAAISALESMGIKQLKALTEDQQEVLTRLRDLAEERLKDFADLKANIS